VGVAGTFGGGHYRQPPPSSPIVRGEPPARGGEACRLHSGGGGPGLGGHLPGEGVAGALDGGHYKQRPLPPDSEGRAPSKGGARGALRGGSGGYLGGRW
jgi:hypothetical protein